MEDQIKEADFILIVCTETYLRRVNRLEAPGQGRGVLWEATLIYNLLYGHDSDIQPFIPVVFTETEAAWIPLPFQGLTHYSLTGAGYEALRKHLIGQTGLEVPELGNVPSFPRREPASFPASLGAKPTRSHTARTMRLRHRLIKRVGHDWIEGVLEQSLYKAARLELGLSDKSELVERPLDAVVRVPDRLARAMPPGTHIAQVFDEEAGALLILGAPGSGKTTLLLELARYLLGRAAADEHHPIPVVFNLSSWVPHHHRLRDWLVAELRARSGLPEDIAEEWVDAEQILPLLDGLDEVVESYRESCVDAINIFRCDHGLLPIAVCSRITDYQELGTKLRLCSAVEIQPLARDQVEVYLERAGEPLSSFRSHLAVDTALWQILDSPLMLSVAMLAYRDGPRSTVQLEMTAQERRRGLFERYVDVMLGRRGDERRYTRAQTTEWLSTLARTMARLSRTVFHLEDLNRKWVFTKRQYLIVDCVSGLCAVITGLAVGTFLGLIARLPVSVGSWWVNAPVLGTLFGTGYWMIEFLGDGPGQDEDKAIVDVHLPSLLGEFVYTIVFGWAASLRIEPRLFRITAVWLTIKALHRIIRGPGAVLQVFPSFGTALMLSAVIFPWNDDPGHYRDIVPWIDDKKALAVIVGLAGGLVLSFFTTLLKRSGPAPVDLHAIMRIALWWCGRAPFRYQRFLNYATERILLRRVGEGYIFIHRLLLDYFAALPNCVDRE